MRTWFISALIVFMAACSEAPKETTTKAPKKAPEPLTGRQAYQRTFPSARGWAPDSQPLRIHSIDVEGVPSSDGKAGAWEITYVSVESRRFRIFNWSAVEAGGDLHEGVYGVPAQSWGGPSGQERVIVPAAIVVDTPDAYKTAVAASADYFKKPGKKPPVTFILESTSRFPDPAWHILWGTSAAAAEYSVFIDATTGKLLQRVL